MSKASYSETARILYFCPPAGLCTACWCVCRRAGRGAFMACATDKCAASPALGWSGAQVSGNHRLDDSKAERARVEAAGAEVAASVLEGKPVGPLRVWPGGLAMSRSLGDHPVRAARH